MKKLFLFVLLLFLIGFSKCYSQSDRWQYIGTKTNSLIYIDTKTIQYSNSDKSYKVWIKFVDDNGYQIQLVIYYCGKYTFIIKEVDFFDSYGNYENVYYPNNLETILPESNPELIYDYLCK